MAPIVPHELSDRIIDCLTSKRALGRCSVVSKNWISRARRHLWRLINLNCDNDTSKLSRFLDLVTHSPALGSNILSLNLSYYYEPKDNEPYPRGIIFSLIQALPALQALILESVRLNLSHAIDVDLSNCTVKTLSIKKTKFADILHFHHFVHAFPLLDNLAVGPEVFWDAWDDTDLIEGSTFKIDRLEIGADDVDASVISWLQLLSSVDVTTLTAKHSLVPRTLLRRRDPKIWLGVRIGASYLGSPIQTPKPGISTITSGVFRLDGGV